MNAQRTIEAIYAIGERLDKVDVDATYEGTTLADEEVLAIRARACGALAGIVSLLSGKEVGIGSEVIAQKMLTAAIRTDVSRLNRGEACDA